MIEQTVTLSVGGAEAFVTHPERDGPHPVVLIFMDAFGLREELRDMARRIAATGYYVIVPNLYHRLGIRELADLPVVPQEEAIARMVGFVGQVQPDEVMADGDACLAYAAKDIAADAGRVAAIGYCMSGQHAVRFAARHPREVRAAASFYGVRIMTDEPDSSHLTLTDARAEFYFGFGDQDHLVPAETTVRLGRFISDAGVAAEVEMYGGAGHGFAFPSRPSFDRGHAERHWERIFSLLARTLR